MSVSIKLNSIAPRLKSASAVVGTRVTVMFIIEHEGNTWLNGIHRTKNRNHEIKKMPHDRLCYSPQTSNLWAISFWSHTFIPCHDLFPHSCSKLFLFKTFWMFEYFHKHGIQRTKWSIKHTFGPGMSMSMGMHAGNTLTAVGELVCLPKFSNSLEHSHRTIVQLALLNKRAITGKSRHSFRNFSRTAQAIYYQIVMHYNFELRTGTTLNQNRWTLPFQQDHWWWWTRRMKTPESTNARAHIGIIDGNNGMRWLVL